MVLKFQAQIIWQQVKDFIAQKPVVISPLFGPAAHAVNAGADPAAQDLEVMALQNDGPGCRHG